MRVTNAKMTHRSGGHSKRNAKRSVLLALLIASGSPAFGPGSTAYGQWPTQSRFQNSNPPPKIVRQGARINSTMTMGAVRINPFVAPAETTQSQSARSAQQRVPGSAGLSANSAITAATPYSARSSAPDSARSNAFFRENSQLAQPSPDRFNDRPLVQLGQGNVAPVVPAEAVDRLSSSPSGNAFASQKRRGEVLLPVVPSAGASISSPIPLAIAPNSAEPIGSAPAFFNSDRRAAPIGVATDASRVIPVADAREDQAEIKETQPIFFTLSDDSAPVSEATLSGSDSEKGKEPVETVAKSKPEPSTEAKASVEAKQADATDSSATSAVAASESAIKPVDGVRGDTESGTEPKADAEPKAASEPKSAAEEKAAGKASDPPEEQTADTTTPPPTIDTPVKLAPMLNFAAESMPEATTVADGEPGEIRSNPNVTDSSEDAEGDAHGLVAIAKRNVPTTKTPMIDSKRVGAIQLKREAVAVATPPIQIERLQPQPSDASGIPVANAIVQPVLDPSSLDPSRLPELSATNERTPTETNFEPVARKSVRSALTELPAVAERSAGIAAFTPVPKKVPSVRADIPELPPPGRRIEGAVTVKPVDASKLETDAGNASALVDSPVQFNPTKRTTPPAQRGIVTPARLASSQQNENRNSIGESPAAGESTSLGPGRHNVLLQLSRAQVRSMTIGGRLRRVEIADKDVCQAFASSANQIKLIGTGIGTTKLTIWADIVPGEPTRMQTFEIDVSETVDAIGEKVTEHTNLLNESIDRAFPRASVVVSRRGGELLVTGRCDDEATAKQIIRMVRKSCLVPVQDNLDVRR